jgi:hypothetical protein
MAKKASVTATLRRSDHDQRRIAGAANHEKAPKTLALTAKLNHAANERHRDGRCQEREGESPRRGSQ